jgi:hypothetical protein
MVEMVQSDVTASWRVDSSPSKAQPAVAIAKQNAGGEVRDFPTASRRERKIPIISDEILEFYAFLFCQGRYGSLGMTFEHFLLVLTSLRLDIAFRN